MKNTTVAVRLTTSSRTSWPPRAKYFAGVAGAGLGADQQERLVAVLERAVQAPRGAGIDDVDQRRFTLAAISGASTCRGCRRVELNTLSYGVSAANAGAAGVPKAARRRRSGGCRSAPPVLRGGRPSCQLPWRTTPPGTRTDSRAAAILVDAGERVFLEQNADAVVLRACAWSGTAKRSCPGGGRAGLQHCRGSWRGSPADGRPATASMGARVRCTRGPRAKLSGA